MSGKKQRRPARTPAKTARSFSVARGLVVAAVLAFVGAGVWAVQERDPADAAPGEVVVYKSPTCGCCKEWVAHMREAGFTVTVNDRSDMDPIKVRHGVPAEMESCHTAVVDGYVLEGHVPAHDVRRLLAQRPALAGLAVPGMPAGAPGMEQGGHREPYKVLTFGGIGPKTFARY